MTYKDNTPNYNVNRRVVNYKDFLANSEAEKEKLKTVKRSFTPNSDRQNFTTNTRNEYDPVTHKITAYNEEEVEDRLDALDENFEESVINESQVDYDLLNKLQKLEAYKTLREEFRNSVDKFTSELMRVADQIGYDEGETDHDMAVSAAIQEALDEFTGGW